MSINSTKTRMLNDALRSMTSCNAILLDIPEAPTADDVQAIINAANQAQQTANELRILEGFIRGITRG